jgi:N-acetyl-anhydromuramyl-L-alanine amidase AmpD
MSDLAQNQQVLGQLKARIDSIDAIIKDPSASPSARAAATDARALLTEEQALRETVAFAKTPAEQQKAKADLAAFRRETRPSEGDGSSLATCKSSAVFVHLHMRFLLPKQLLLDLRDRAKYPRRVANCPEATFKKMYSFEGMSVPAQKRWQGDHPVAGATVKLAGKTAVTDRRGAAKFEDICAGTYTIEIEPPPEQRTTTPAGPDLPVRSGYSFASAPPAQYRPFTVTAKIDGDGRWAKASEVTVALPHKGDSADYAGVAGVTSADLYLDWKPDWLKALNRNPAFGRVNKGIVMHQTSTFLHEQIGSPIDWFSNSTGNKYRTSSHYLVDLDGHVLKLVHEEEVANHAGPSSWHGAGMNTSGIGIETVHTDTNVMKADGKLREFPAEQYVGINRLLERLRAGFKISRAHVCGHNDCKGEPKPTCPGDMFDWKSLEDAGNALKTLTGGAFAGSRAVSSGSKTADNAAAPLAQALYKIGYTNKTVKDALIRFSSRAWSGSRFEARPKAQLEPAAARAPEQVTQAVADAIDQMLRDL